METGILYAVIAGFFWGTSPILVKRERVDSDVSAATLTQQAAILFTLILFTLLEGTAATGQISAVSMLVFAGALQAIGSVFYLECAALRPCFGGRAHLEYATDHQLFSCAGHPERDRSCDIQRWDRGVSCYRGPGDAVGVRAGGSGRGCCQFPRGPHEDQYK